MSILKEDHTRPLESYAPKEEAPKEYKPRPVWQLILAWVLIAVVLFAFLGVCYWMMFYKQ